MSKINSRQKGKRGELQLAKHLTNRGYPARRGQQFKGSPDSPDIICESLRHLHFECKFVEALNVYKALRQAREDSDETQTPVVIHRRKKEKWHVTLDLDDFLTLLEYENRMQVYTPELGLPE